MINSPCRKSASPLKSVLAVSAAAARASLRDQRSSRRVLLRHLIRFTGLIYKSKVPIGIGLCAHDGVPAGGSDCFLKPVSAAADRTHDSASYSRTSEYNASGKVVDIRESQMPSFGGLLKAAMVPKYMPSRLATFRPPEPTFSLAATSPGMTARLHPKSQL